MLEENVPWASFPSKMYKQMMSDIKEYSQGMDVLMNPPSVKVGATPAETIYEERPVKLIRYKPLKKGAHGEPLLLIYALVNKPYILDLQPNRSVVRNLLEQGFDVYMIDWGVPDDIDMFLTIDDYVNYFIDVCVDRVRKKCECEKINILGYCMGGTLSTMYCSLHKEKVKNMILMAAPLASRPEMGMLHLWSKKEHFDVDLVTDVYGNVPAEFLNGGFLMLDPIGNLIGKYLKFFEKADDEDFVKMFTRMEKWIHDGIPVAAETYSKFIKDIYQDNKLAKNEFEIDGKKIDIKSIDIPVLFLVGKYDNLVPPESTLDLSDKIGSDDVTIMENKTGHIGLSVSSKSHRGLWKNVGEWLLEHSSVEFEGEAEYDLSSVEGIGPAYEEKLNEVGVFSREDLEKADLEKLAEQTGISEKRLKKWQDSITGEDL